MAKIDYESQHFDNVESFTRKIRLLYYAAIREAVSLGLSVNVDPKKPFAFSDFPLLNKRVKALFDTLAAKSLATIDSGTQHEWLLSASKNDELVKSIIDTSKIPKETVERFMDRNLDALKAFQSRKSEGMNLSDRIWKQTEQFKTELQLGLDVGIAEGKSANELSRDIRSYMDNPDLLFRRVRDARGVLHLSKAALSVNPGRGVYRSSFKNAQRLTRTTINMAYRNADYERWQTLPFVVGLKLSRSNNPFPCRLCDSMVGIYPKSYKWSSNHPNCRCSMTSILATKDERDKLTQQILDGENIDDFRSVNEVRKMPSSFTGWISDNKERLLRAKSQPYFIKENFIDGQVAKGLRFQG